MDQKLGTVGQLQPSRLKMVGGTEDQEFQGPSARAHTLAQTPAEEVCNVVDCSE